MVETFSPFGLSPGTASEVEPRVLMADFGDGYAHRAGDGLNTMKLKYDVVFSALTNAEKSYIVEFFRAHKGYRCFAWSPPGATVAAKFIARRWRESHPATGLFDVSATLEQVFDLS